MMINDLELLNHEATLKANMGGKRLSGIDRMSWYLQHHFFSSSRFASHVKKPNSRFLANGQRNVNFADETCVQNAAARYSDLFYR